MVRMKIYDLLCGGGHRFEGWFSSAEEFAGQQERGLVSCPTCGSSEVRRVPSATRANFGATAPVPVPAPAPATDGQPVPQGADGKDAFAIAQLLYSRMLDEILAKSEDVGTNFAAEARKIHREEAPARSIRGKASDEEHEALVEEGIPVARLPIPPTDQWN
jgi:hypothetical protein